MELVETKITYPQELLVSLKETEEGLVQEIKVLASVKLFELGRLSLGKAAKLAEMSKWGFIKTLSDYKVSIFHLSKDELNRDVENA